MKTHHVFTRSSAINVLICVLIIFSPFTISTMAIGEIGHLDISTFDQQNYSINLPLVIKSVNEVDIPPCRWPHIIGTYMGISYKWGDRLQIPGSLWRNSFEASISDWTGIPTKLYFFYSTDGSTVFNTYNMQDSRSGYTEIVCSGSTTLGVNVYGNVYYEPGNNNIRRAYTGHETGHAQSIGHISSSEIALMGNNPNPNIYFIPQTLDIDLVNQIYR